MRLFIYKKRCIRERIKYELKGHVLHVKGSFDAAEP